MRDSGIIRKIIVVFLSAVLITIMCPVCVMAAGNTYMEATQISLDTTYRGTIVGSDNVDYYKFTLPDSGYLTIKTQAEIYCVKYCLFYGEDATEAVSSEKSVYWDSVSQVSNYTFGYYLTAGTYYLRVLQSYSYSGDYSIKLGFESSNESFKEYGSGSNNSLTSANNIKLNTKYRGCLAVNDSIDFYKFVMPAADTVNIVGAFYVEGLNLYIYNSEGQQIEYIAATWDQNSQVGSYTLSKALDKGTYYFAVARHSWYSSNGVFEFTVKTENIKPVSITTQPKDYTGAVGSTASFSVAAQGKGLTYQWQVYSNGAWKNSNAASAKTSKLTFNVTENHDGMKYRCVVKDIYGQKVVSNTVSVKVSASISITKQPSNVTGSVGDTASFSVTAQGTGLQYQWQMYSNGAWKNSGATGAKTSKITFKIAQSHNGMKYRCIVTNSKGQKLYSNTATVKVVPALSITKQPANVTCTAGKTVAFSVTATGEGLTYQWQIYSNGTWRNSAATGATTSKISFKATKNHNGKKYRCIIADKNGNALITNAVTITVK